jgi:hypothetical protein
MANINKANNISKYLMQIIIIIEIINNTKAVYMTTSSKEKYLVLNPTQTI